MTLLSWLREVREHVATPMAADSIDQAIQTETKRVAEWEERAARNVSPFQDAVLQLETEDPHAVTGDR